MSLDGKHALITGSSRGIGRGIALMLAEKGVRVAINYFQNEAAAKDTLAKVKERGSDGFLIQADVLRPLPQDIQDATRAWHESGWTPMRRLGIPEDIGNAVTLLCMEEAGFITGQIIHVDGGASIMDTVFPLEIQRG